MYLGGRINSRKIGATEFARVKGVTCIRYVGRAHPGDTRTLARIHALKNRCAYLSKEVKPLRVSVTEKTIAHIRHKKDLSAHPILQDMCRLEAVGKTNIL